MPSLYPGGPGLQEFAVAVILARSPAFAGHSARSSRRMRPAVSPLHAGLITGVSCRHGAKGAGTTGDVNVKEIINDLTLSQMMDLLCHILRCPGTHRHPGSYLPPQGAVCLMMESPGETVCIWVLDGWPDAVTVPESGFVYVIGARP